MTDVADLKARIAAFVRANNISPETFAERLDLSPSLLEQVTNLDWDPRASTLETCLAYIRENDSAPPEEFEPVEYELPWDVIHREGNTALKDCASIWSTVGRRRFSTILELLGRHEMAGRVAVNRMADNHRLYMDRFNPRTWGEPRYFEGVPVSELPDKKFGQWAERSLARDYRLNRPRLVACRISMETSFGRHIVPYTALRLPCGPIEGTPDQIITITRLEASPYKTAQDAHVAVPEPSPPSGRSGHLRLVKS